MFRTPKHTFQKLLCRQPNPDWNDIRQICDFIRQGDVKAKHALNDIREQLYDNNPLVVLSALRVLEACVKNCGSVMHAEISSRKFIEEFRLLAKTASNEKVRSKILQLMQTWAHAFRNNPKYIAVQNTVDLMKKEGYTFPTLEQSDPDEAPKWAEEHCCYRCRVAFSVVQRKHHCRNCGNAFCSKCSSKSASIPRYEIEKDVRVCDSCWDQLNKQPSLSNENATDSEHLASNSSTQDGSKGKTEQELQKEEELQLALALSESEAAARTAQVYQPPSSLYKSEYLSEIASSFERNSDESIKRDGNNNMESELARCMNPSFWEKKEDTTFPITLTRPTPSAPPLTDDVDEAPNTFTTQPPASFDKGGGLNESYSFSQNSSHKSSKESGNNNMESELARYMNSSFREKKEDTTFPITLTRPTPSAPPLTDDVDEAPNTFTTQPPASFDKGGGLNEAYSFSQNSSHKSSKESGNNNMESESAHYLNHSICEKKQDEILPSAFSELVPSAPPSTDGTHKASNNFTTQKVTEMFQNGDVDKMQEFLSSTQTTIEIFVDRMKKNYIIERPLANDAYVQSLFMNISSMHSQLLKYIHEQYYLRDKYEGLQNALSQLRDARAVLDALREEHMERRRREAEETKRQRQLQMAQKLEIMRKHKQEFLQHQSEIALKRIQEKEREMSLSQEQQIQQYQVMKQVPNLSPGSLPPAGVYGPLPPSQAPFVSNAVDPVNYSTPAPAIAAYEPPVHLQFSSPVSIDPSKNALASYIKQNYQSLNTQAMAGRLPALPQSGQYPQGNVPVLLPSLPKLMPCQPPAAIDLPSPNSMAYVPPVMSPHPGPKDSVPGAISEQSEPAPHNTWNMHQRTFPTNPPMLPPGTAVPEQYQLPPPPPEQLNETPLIAFD